MEQKTQIMPLYSMVMVELYEENPYEKNETETGLKLTSGEFDNPDTGNRDKKVQEVFCGNVLEVGPACKYVKQGDDVLLPINCVRPITFKDKVYFIIAEEHLITVMANDLSERLKKL